MIATLAEIKLLLGITDNDSDSRINAYIPVVEDEIIRYTNCHFLDNDIVFGGSCTITVSGSTYKIECATGGMDDSGILANDIIYLHGTRRDDGYYNVTSVADGFIQVNEPLTANSTAASLDMTLVSFPYGLKITVARMIGYQLSHANDAGMQSETIKSYSYSRAAGGNSDAGYPAEILRGLDRYKVIKTGRSQRREQFIDRRGNYVATVITDDSLRRGTL